MKRWCIPTVREALWILALMPVGGLFAGMLYTASSSDLPLRDEYGRWRANAHVLLTVIVIGTLGVPLGWLLRTNERRNTRT